MSAFRTPRHRLTWLIAALITTLIGIAIGITNGTSAFAAGSVSSVTFTGSTLVAKAPANWTVGFTTSNGQGSLAAGGTITATFDPAFTVTGGLSVTLGSTFVGCSATASGSSSGAITVVLTGNPCALAKATSASLTITGIVNPLPGSYANTTFSVATSSDTTAVSPSAGVTTAAGTATQFAFTQQPAGAVSGTAFTTQPKVAVQDAFGNTVTTDNTVVTLSITSGTPSAGGPGVLSGCTSVRSGGVSTFSGCKINTAGTSYRLHAAGTSLTSGDSAAFNVTSGPAAQLAFTTAPPAAGTAGSALPTFRVSVEDASGDPVTTGSGSTDIITLSIASGPPGGTFNGGTTSVSAVAGVATFSGVVFNTAGSYTLTASDATAGHTGFTTATSGAIVISPQGGSRLVFVQGPSSVFAGSTMSPAVTVQLQDSNGNAVSTSGVSVTLALSSGVVDGGASATTNSSGRATFSGVVINTAAVALTMTASSAGLTATAASAPFNVTVAVSNGAALTDAASDGGAGVKTVAYYYCTGYTGACTSASWTSIGSSTTAAGNYPVTWNAQPANGAYRLVVVGTDNVTNVSQPSQSIPVTVSN
ncbi:hypothetical protein F1D05_09000 [Kribbella qitaiheensis]|uniref:Big-1 domain-containing protein n=1 Tax=Kribbella qitaiheensis TaxID=1544730 RepID=A0A7G6WVH9_9ACTN|nr:hypothetical protein [Kribbella qitaiheensis]QNE17994.1 hypothetical protein F1D05_09000 [Kribbella qitaiheensis]